MNASSPFGQLLKTYRAEKALSQLSLATKAGVSPRHMSFLETGKSDPSRETVLVLGEALHLSLRDRNSLLGAAGFAPVYRETPLTAATPAIQQAIAGLLAAAGNNPAWVVNRRFDVLENNRAARVLLDRFCAEPPPKFPNLARLLLSPQGLRGSVLNVERVILHVLERILREVGGVHARAPGDDEFLAEILPAAAELRSRGVQPYDTLLVPVTFAQGGLQLSLFTAITTFGSPSDVALQELRIETLFPLDEPSASLWARLSS